jgi:ABC-type multidrug transport system ATPase subunit
VALFHRLADAGTTVLVSSHVMDEAERCERLLLMREGELLADDSPPALLARTGAADVEERSSTSSTGGSSGMSLSITLRWPAGCSPSSAATRGRSP